jgi:hypothetical protein
MESKQDEDQAAAISISIKGKKTRKRKTSGQPKPLDDKRKKKDRIDAISPRRRTPTTNEKRRNSVRTNNENTKKKIKVLNGLTLAITISSSHHDKESIPSNIHNDKDCMSPVSKEEETAMTYKKACSIAEDLGAKTTAQVHNRVFAVICNESAIQQSTQRVRKALKKCIPLIHVKWLQECKEKGNRVDIEEYLLTDDAQVVVANREQIAQDLLTANASTKVNANDSSFCKEVDVMDESDEEIINAHLGWSEPISLDCCCVCHDDDRDDCKWCSGDEKCNIIRMKLGLTSNDGPL